MVSAWEVDQIEPWTRLHVPLFALYFILRRPKESRSPFVALDGHSIFSPSGLSKHSFFMLSLNSQDMRKASVETRKFPNSIVKLWLSKLQTTLLSLTDKHSRKVTCFAGKLCVSAINVRYQNNYRIFRILSGNFRMHNSNNMCAT